MVLRVFSALSVNSVQLSPLSRSIDDAALYALATLTDGDIRHSSSTSWPLLFSVVVYPNQISPR